MNIRLIDYSEIVFGKPLPLHCGGKFVQFQDKETEYLVLSPVMLSKHHATILERFCELNDIEGKYVTKPSHFVFREPGWELLGGGEWTIDEEDKVLHLFGKSISYGKFSAEGLKENI